MDLPEFVKFRADPSLRRAIKLRAALLDVAMQDVIVDLLRKGLTAEIKEVQDRGLVASSEPKRRKTNDAKKGTA